MSKVKEIEALRNERDALAARNHELVLACKLAIDMFIANDCNVPNTIETLQDAIDANPQQCLRDIQAEAGRVGYFEAAMNYDPDYDPWWSADQYAATVRQGGAE